MPIQIVRSTGELQRFARLRQLSSSIRVIASINPLHFFPLLILQFPFLLRSSRKLIQLVMPASFDVAALRKHFPALDKEQIYFDNAGGSQVLQEVIDA